MSLHTYHQPVLEPIIPSATQAGMALHPRTSQEPILQTQAWTCLSQADVHKTLDASDWTLWA